MTERELRRLLKEKVAIADREDLPDKVVALRLTAKRLRGLPGVRPVIVKEHKDGRKDFAINVAQCRAALTRIKGGPSV